MADYPIGEAGSLPTSPDGGAKQGFLTIDYIIFTQATFPGGGGGGTPFVSQVNPWAASFAPRGWAICQGQLLSIASNEALFTLIGAQFGGDGRTTFALPDLRSRIPIGAGQGNDLPNYWNGQAGVYEDSGEEQRAYLAVDFIIALQGIFPRIE